ncbi:unnamed protein product [Rhizoctonia solani]|uniref:Uncharacterized protein n=1 Tax=Rhizoctonia solani TaxID=456999 RepID=A0A8H3HRK6_9AGAM|nr:unnamed protein product [Rhizoctonia solani]
MSAACTTTSPWLRRTPNGLRASKASRSVLHGATPVLATIDEGVGPSRLGFDKQRPASSTASLCPPEDEWPLTPGSPLGTRQPGHPFADVEPGSSDDDESSEEELEFRAPAQVVVIDEVEGSSTIRSPPMSPLSFKSKGTTNTSATDESVQIVRARAQRINTARARSASIHEIRQLLSPPPESQHLLPPWSPLRVNPPAAGTSDLLSRNEPGPATLSPGTSVPQLSPRSLSPASSAPAPPPRSPARRRPQAIVKDMGSLLEHINEDEPDPHLRLNSAVRTSRSVSLPAIARQRSDSALNAVSLPPPPRPRNRALVRTAVQPHSLPATPNLHSPLIQSEIRPPALVLQPPPRRSSLSEKPPAPPPKDSKPVPTLSIPPHCDSLEHHRLSLYSIPLSPVGIPLPPSTATASFPQSPHSTTFYTAGSPPTTPQRASFLPSCKATSARSSTIREGWSSPRLSEASEDRPDRSSNRLSTLSNPFGDFTFLRPLPNNRASGISFASNISGSSARSPTEAECIPIGLHRATSQDAERDDFLLPVTPRSSWLRTGFEVDVLLPRANEDEEDDESITEELSEKSSVLSGRERAKTLTLPCIPIASLNKDAKWAELAGGNTPDVRFMPAAGRREISKPETPHLKRCKLAIMNAWEADITNQSQAARVLGISGGSFLYQHVHDPQSSPSPMSSPENPTPTSAAIQDPAQQSFLPSTAPPSAFSMGIMARRLSKRSSPSSERRRSEDVSRVSPQPGRLMARVDRFIGRTPSPAGRTRELESDDEPSSPPPLLTFPKPIHGRKHSSSDPSAGLAGRPSTSNMRTQAERAELVKKTRKLQQVLGDVPPATGSTFYRVSRAARSEDSLVTPTAVVVIGPPEARGHRSTASLSSRPLLALSPAVQTDGCLDINTPGDDFGLGLNSGGASPVTATRPETEDVDGEGPENEQEVDEAIVARRAKRAKVAKLNRYLGSRVPAHLVLGLDDWDPEQGLPEARSEDEEAGSVFSGKKKRRASDGDYSMLEDGMNDLSVMSSEEKARAVRRKAKMEKMFGERPPQKLYQMQTGVDTPSRSEADAESEPEEEEEGEPLEGSKGNPHYQSYRASFNSLAYFVSNADRDSLEGLYDIISGPAGDSEAQRNQFTARRKRAAKLSNFFGVSYRDLFGAVLDILESDVKEDKEEGALSADETQDLLRKLKSLKDKGQDIRV